MNKKKMQKTVSDKPDSNLAAPYPTAISNDFVPKSIENVADPPTNNSADIFDFIPQLKCDKYK